MVAIQRGVIPNLMGYHLAETKTHKSNYGNHRSKQRKGEMDTRMNVITVHRLVEVLSHHLLWNQLEFCRFSSHGSWMHNCFDRSVFSWQVQVVVAWNDGGVFFLGGGGACFFILGGGAAFLEGDIRGRTLAAPPDPVPIFAAVWSVPSDPALLALGTAFCLGTGLLTISTVVMLVSAFFACFFLLVVTLQFFVLVHEHGVQTQKLLEVQRSVVVLVKITETVLHEYVKLLGAQFFSQPILTRHSRNSCCPKVLSLFTSNFSNKLRAFSLIPSCRLFTCLGLARVGRCALCTSSRLVV